MSFLSTDKGMSHTLVAHDEHDKRLWITALRSVLPDGHEGRESIKRKQLQLKRDNPEGFNMSDMSINSSLSSALGGAGDLGMSVKRTGSSVSDRVVLKSSSKDAVSAAAAAVKRSGSSVSDHQVVYKDYPSLRLLTSPRPHLYDIPDDDEIETRSKRRRSATSTVTRAEPLGESAVKPTRSNNRTPMKSLQSDNESCSSSSQAESPGWGEGHALDDDLVREERGTADGMATP